MGAVFAHAGLAALKWAGLKKIILSLVISPVLGTAVGFIFMLVLYGSSATSPTGLNKNFRRLQIVSAAFMAFSHGTADAQKSMGVITMALVATERSQLYGALGGHGRLRPGHGLRHRRRGMADHQDRRP